MKIVVSKEPPKGFDISVTVPSGYPEEVLASDLSQKIESHLDLPHEARIQVWLENARASDAQLLNALNFAPYRDLLQMRCSLPVSLEGIETRPFLRGRDEVSFLKVNGRAFHWHPEQGALSIENLENLFEESWFEEEGFLLYEIEEKLAGFCWTKIHTAPPENMGEIYAIAVDPDFHGQGIGAPLTISGLHYLANKGISLGMLYVESDNLPAIRIYEKIGFSVHSVNRAFHN